MAEKQIPWSMMAQQQAQSIPPRLNLDPMAQEESDIPMMTKQQVEAGLVTGELDPGQPVKLVERSKESVMREQTIKQRGPMSQEPVPQQLLNQDQSNLAGDMFADAYLAQKQGIGQLEENINQMRQKPKGGLDYSPMVAFAKMHDPGLDNETMMAAAQSLKPESPEQRAEKLFKLQSMLIGHKDDLTKRQLENLKERIAAAKAAKIDPLDRELKLAKIKSYNAISGKTADGLKLPETSVQKISDYDDSLRDLDNMESTLAAAPDLMGPVEGRVNGVNPWNARAQILQADLKRTAQKIGKTMEGGVLRKEDEIKYEKMLPNLADTPEVASAKWAQIRNMLSEGKNSYQKNLGLANYNTKKFSNSKVNPRPAAEPTTSGAGPRDTSQMTPDQLDAYLEELEVGQ